MNGFSSPYSPFFTSGLLSEPLAESSSRPASPDVPLSPRRGSLPTDTSSNNNADQASALFYFTLQPRRDSDEFRSFLSLDLAESQSLRSAASLKRKCSSKKLFKFPCITEDSAPPPAPPRTPNLRLRFSRDSIRTIPSPKPAPSITLPEVPPTTAPSSLLPPSPLPSTPITPTTTSAPRLPSLPALAPITLSPRKSTGNALKIRISRTPAPVPSTSYKFPLPPSSTPTSTRNRISIATKNTSSTVSTRAKRTNRSAALAALEGSGTRTPATSPLAPKPKSHNKIPLLISPPRIQQQRNFMSMSDDEDSSDSSHADADDESDDFFFYDSAAEEDGEDYRGMFSALTEPEDVVFPLSASSSFLESPRSAPLPPSSSHPIHPHASVHPVKRHASRTHKSTTSGKDWFPLKSFIDLDTRSNSNSGHGHQRHSTTTTTNASAGRRSRGDSWSWRSFIEVAHVS